VRVPQKYPGKRHYKGPAKGEFSGNPLGKNPGDVWDIPNVKGNHIEKVNHPCQFPVALVQRLVRALCPPNGVLLDPYMGSGSAGVAALAENRRFIGIELDRKYFKLASTRLKAAAEGKALFRPIERPIFTPDPRSEVATIPPHFFRLAAE
jgi:adenine-specific DNA-methyltransferase